MRRWARRMEEEWTMRRLEDEAIRYHTHEEDIILTLILIILY
jgi:hypothetical protein